jgi:hypothetical protein
MDELRSVFDLGIFMLRRFGRLWPLHASLLAGFVGIELLKYAAALLHVPLDTAPLQLGQAGACDSFEKVA